MSVTLQWILFHCGVGDNEEADLLSKMGSKLELSTHLMSYSDAKTIPRNNFRTEWRQLLDIGTEEDSIHQLDRAAQVTIFSLRTRHCQLLSHFHRLCTKDPYNVLGDFFIRCHSTTSLDDLENECRFICFKS